MITISEIPTLRKSILLAFMLISRLLSSIFNLNRKKSLPLRYLAIYYTRLYRHVDATANK